MVAIASILSVIGLVVMLFGFLQRSKATRITSAPFVKTGDAASKGDSVAGPKGAIAVEGDVKCAQPLTAPCSGTPCLYYELQVVGTWKEGDSQKSHDYVEEKKAAEFSLDDGSGPLKIMAEGGGDFEPFEKTFDETKKEGFFADLKAAVGKGEPIMFGKYAFANPPMSKADKFNCLEKTLKVQKRFFVLGKLEKGAVVTPSWRSLIIDYRSRDVLLAAALKTAKMCLIGGGATLGVGVILGIVSRIM
jgi:hypothetical protein